MGDWFEKVTIGAMLDRAAARFSIREALTFAGQRWNFEEFKADCDRAAACAAASPSWPAPSC